MASNEVALLVVYEYAEAAHMIIEHVGTLHVVVVLELQVNTHVTRRQVVVHQVVAAAEHTARHDESPSHAYILDPTVKLLVCHDAYLFYEKVKCIN